MNARAIRVEGFRLGHVDVTRHDDATRHYRLSGVEAEVAVADGAATVSGILRVALTAEERSVLATLEQTILARLEA